MGPILVTIIALCEEFNKTSPIKLDAPVRSIYSKDDSRLFAYPHGWYTKYIQFYVKGTNLEFTYYIRVSPDRSETGFGEWAADYGGIPHIVDMADPKFFQKSVKIMKHLLRKDIRAYRRNNVTRSH